MKFFSNSAPIQPFWDDLESLGGEDGSGTPRNIPRVVPSFVLSHQVLLGRRCWLFFLYYGRFRGTSDGFCWLLDFLEAWEGQDGSWGQGKELGVDGEQEEEPSWGSDKLGTAGITSGMGSGDIPGLQEMQAGSWLHPKFQMWSPMEAPLPGRIPDIHQGVKIIPWDWEIMRMQWLGSAVWKSIVSVDERGIMLEIKPKKVPVWGLELVLDQAGAAWESGRLDEDLDDF